MFQSNVARLKDKVYAGTLVREFVALLEGVSDARWCQYA